MSDSGKTRFGISYADSVHNTWSELRSRRIVFGGILSALGVVSGWLVFIASQRPLAAFLGALVGGVVAALVEGCKRYVQIARCERNGNSELSASNSSPSTLELDTIVQAGLITVFVASSICVSVAGELVYDMLLPCLMSLVTLLPIGMFFAGNLADARRASGVDDVHPPYLLFVGCLLGAVAAGIAMLARVFSGVTEFAWTEQFRDELFGLVAWWSLVGIGLAVFCRNRLTVIRSIGAIGLAFVILWSFVGTTPAVQKSLWFKTLSVVATQAVRSPDIPAAMWDQAISHGDSMSGEESEPSDDADKSVDSDLGKELKGGLRSGVVRSCFVLLLFSLGLGISPSVESSLRPIPYFGSKTRQIDRIALVILLIVCLAAIVILRRNAV